MKDLLIGAARAAFAVADDVLLPFTFLANSVSNYNTTTGINTVTGTTVIVDGLYYEVKTSRPIVRAIEGIYPEPPAITTPTGLFLNEDFVDNAGNPLSLKIDDPVTVNGKLHKITDIDTDSIPVATIISLQVQ
jgi:hypothetical protein